MLVAKRPASFRQTVKLEGIGTFDRGYNGKEAWVSNAYFDVPLFHSKTDQEAKEDAEFFCWFNASEEARGLAAPASFDARDCYELQRGGTGIRDFYDAKTFLLAGSVSEMMTTTGPTWSTVAFSDYQAVEGFLFPTGIHVKQEGDEHTLRLEKFWINDLKEGGEESVSSQASISACRPKL
jgi:hypothetical protein